MGRGLSDEQRKILAFAAEHQGYVRVGFQPWLIDQSSSLLNSGNGSINRSIRRLIRRGLLEKVYQSDSQKRAWGYKTTEVIGTLTNTVPIGRTDG